MTHSALRLLMVPAPTTLLMDRHGLRWPPIGPHKGFKGAPARWDPPGKVEVARIRICGPQAKVLRGLRGRLAPVQGRSEPILARVPRNESPFLNGQRALTSTPALLLTTSSNITPQTMIDGNPPRTTDPNRRGETTHPFTGIRDMMIERSVHGLVS
jgi:hypothetical protein